MELRMNIHVDLLQRQATRRNKPPFNDAIKGITAALDELDAVAAAEQAEVDRLEGLIEQATLDRDAATGRADRARKVAARFAGLIAAT
jgi:hypothetical protein